MIEQNILIQKIKELSKSKFVRNVAIVATGTAGAQVITMAFAPIITRLYDPEAFGLLGTFVAVLGVLTPIAALSYPVAIVLPKSDADAKQLARLSAGLAFVIAGITALIILGVGDFIATALGMQAITAFLLLIPLAMLFSAFQQIFTQWLIRKKQFKITAKVAVIQALSINSVKAGVGWYHPIGAALIVIATVGEALYAGLLWLGISRRDVEQSNEEKSTGSISQLAKRHKDFPLYRAPQILLNALSQSLPILILASFFGPAVAGFFALTKSALAAPAFLVGNSVGNVFYPKAVELYDNLERLHYFLFRTTLFLVFSGVIVFFPILLFGPWIFAFVFGADWLQAGEFAQWVSLWMIVSLAARPAISVIPVLGMQKSFMLIEMFFLPIKVISLYLGVLISNEALAVALYSVSSCVFYIVLYFLVSRKILSSGAKKSDISCA